MTQTCRTCKRNLPLSAFNVEKRKRNGKRSECRDCQNAYDRERKPRLRRERLGKTEVAPVNCWGRRMK